MKKYLYVLITLMCVFMITACQGSENNPQKVVITGETEVIVGKTITLTAVVEPAEANQSITWKSSDLDVATVSAGVVNGIGVGKAIITATATGTDISSSVEVEVAETEYDFTDLTTRDYISENGIVAAANPYAAKAGIDVLKAGGNAFDAAAAVSFALGVVEPNASGVGGGGIMVAYQASTGKYISYNFREFVPAAGTPSAFPNTDADIDGGIKSSGVPTQVAGLLAIINDLGSKNLTRQQLMAPAIDYAKNGVIVTPELAQAISDDYFKIMMSRDEMLSVFTSDMIAPLTAGEKLVQPAYAHTLELISEKGLDGFYTGETAEAIVSLQEAKGGLITLEDLKYAKDNYPIKSDPVQGTYRGYDIISANSPSSGGIILLETLNMLEAYGDISKLDHNSSEYVNVIATAMQLAYGDKRQYIADDKFVNVPTSGLISKAYAAERWLKYTTGKAYLGRNQGDNDYGNPIPYVTNNKQPLSYDNGEWDYNEHQSTTSFSICDKDGNVVSITQTINYFFGNGCVPAGTGFFMNNQLSSFSFTPSSVHYIAPLKQPVSHIMPTIIMKDSNPWATLGSPGGMRIPSAVIQVVVNLIDFNMSIQEAIAAPRVYSYAVASTDAGGANAKDLYVERAFDEKTVDELTAMGYYVIRQGAKDIDLFFGGVQGIRFDYNSGKMHGGADPRRDGKALGY